MRRKIPSSTALMAFEVAARHGSFARAAEELASILSTGGTRLPLRPVNNATPLYLSVFAC
mgnify:CR=1 FL=1